MVSSPAVYILHENPEWFPPLEAAFAAEGVPVREWLLTEGSIDLLAEPPDGVFWSRLSASAHTRGNPESKEYARAVLHWLEASGRRVVNGSGVLEYEVSKAAQYAALRSHGIEVPATIAVFGRNGLAQRAREFAPPFIVKHNQGGKGTGVRRFDTYEQFDDYVASVEFSASPDGITLLQEYLQAEAPFVTRVEFAGSEYLYAVRVDTAAGGFEFCPADACVVPDAPGGSVFRPFQLREGFDGNPIIRHYLTFLSGIGAEVAGIEFIETVDGRVVTYDVNTNTNYNPEVEAQAAHPGARRVARFLGGLLADRYAVEAH